MHNRKKQKEAPYSAERIELVDALWNIVSSKFSYLNYVANSNLNGLELSFIQSGAGSIYHITIQGWHHGELIQTESAGWQWRLNKTSWLTGDDLQIIIEFLGKNKYKGFFPDLDDELPF